MTPIEMFNTLEGIRNLSQLKVDKKDQERLNALLKEPAVEETEKDKAIRLKTIQGLEKKLAASNIEQNQKKIQEALESLKKNLNHEISESWVNAFSNQISSDWVLSEEEKALNQERLIKTLPSADVSKYNPVVYAKMLTYAKLLSSPLDKDFPEEQAYKLAVLFEKEEDALKYLKTTLNRALPNVDTKKDPAIVTMGNACSFNLPIGEYDLPVWRKLCIKFLDKPEFHRILAQANVIEEFIKKSQNKQSSTPAKIRQITSEIEKLNSSFKDLKSKHSQVNTAAKEKEYADKLSELVEKRRELISLGVPFNDQLTMVALESFREIYNIDNSPVLKYFLKNGLTKEDYAKFVELDRSNAGANIPNIKLDGADFGYPGYYFMKVEAQDDMQAARAACLGKLTDCCQSLSGEQGEPCVKYGLTSHNSGFYVLCEGDINNAKVEDKLIGQCWVWRSKTNALVFDSIETMNFEEETLALTKDFFEAAARKLVDENHTYKVACGDNSGISEKVGIKSIYQVKEDFIDYSKYSDAVNQNLIIDKTQPFYWYNADENFAVLTKDLLKKIFQTNLPLIKAPNFIALIDFAMKEENIDLLKLMAQYAKETNRESELNQIIENIKKFYDNQFSIEETLDLIKRNMFYVDTRNKETATPLMQAANIGEPILAEELIKMGADINAQENNAHYDAVTNTVITDKTVLMHAAIGGNLDILKLLIANRVNLNFKNSNLEFAMVFAAQNGHKAFVLELIVHGAFTDFDEDLLATTPLIAAAKAGHKDIVEMLIQNGAKVNVKYFTGETALIEATNAGHKEIMDVLIKNGAEVNAKNSIGETALMKAISRKDINLVSTLIENGAQINTVELCPMSELPQNDYNQAMDHKIYVAPNGDYICRDPKGIVRQGNVPDFDVNDILIKKTFNRMEDFKNIVIERGDMHVDGGSSMGISLLKEACFKGDQSIVLALIQNGADMNTFPAGFTMLEYAKKEKWNDVINYIQQHEKQKKDIDLVHNKPVTFRFDNRPQIAQSSTLPEQGSAENDPSKNKPG